MQQADVYVVRVYRREAGGATGVVEDVARGKSQTFRTAGELIELILRRPDPQAAARSNDKQHR